MLPIKPYKTHKQIIKELAEKHNLSEAKINLILNTFFGRQCGLMRGVRYQRKMRIREFGNFFPNSKGKILAKNRFEMWKLDIRESMMKIRKRKLKPEDEPKLFSLFLHIITNSNYK